MKRKAWSSIEVIIDRDYRSNYELQCLADDHVYPLQVAEVENLFLVEALIRFMASQLGGNPGEAFANVKDHVSQKNFTKQIDKQICQAVVANLKYQLSCADVSNKNVTEAKSILITKLENNVISIVCRVVIWYIIF